MKRVITYGTFDLIHEGHIRLLESAKKLGDHLTVGLSTDSFNTLKSKDAYHDFQKRKYILEAIRYVDKIIPEQSWEQKVTDILEHKIDVFVIGEDWKGEFDFLQEYCEVIYLPRTEDISTSKIKEDLSRNSN